MKYKVGDRVIGISECASGKNIKGKKGTVIKTDPGIRICVEFDENIHGHNCCGEGKRDHCWWVSWHNDVEQIEECTAKIVITSDGKETLARLYDGKKVIKTATANCAPEDTFDFAVGARIAYDRLMGDTKPEEKEWRVVNRPVMVGDYIRLKKKSFSFSEAGDILKVEHVHKSKRVDVMGRNHPRLTIDQDRMWSYLKEEYEVVEPVKQKEEKPKYYNGKVVCVANREIDLTAGKVYEFINGKVKDDAAIIDLWAVVIE